MANLAADEIDDIREVFDLFDFWDGRDGAVDAHKVGDLMRSLGYNPMNGAVEKLGGTKAMGEKQYTFDEFLPIYQELCKEKDTGSFADFMEAFKTFDREGQGFISAAELRHLLTALGERLSDKQVDQVVKATDTREDIDGNIKYEEFIKKVMSGPSK